MHKNNIDRFDELFIILLETHNGTFGYIWKICKILNRLFYFNDADLLILDIRHAHGNFIIDFIRAELENGSLEIIKYKDKYIFRDIQFNRLSIGCWFSKYKKINDEMIIIFQKLILELLI